MLTNTARLEQLLQRDSLDAVIATCAENVTYLSGFWAMSQWVRRGPQCYVLHPRDGAPALIANSGIIDLVADQDIWVEDIRRYGFFQVDVAQNAALDEADSHQKRLFETAPHKGPIEALASALKDRGLTRARIGVDELGITPQHMQQLREAVPEADFVPAFGLIERVRSIKTEAEIERLRRAAFVSERSIDAALGAAKEGLTEQEMLRVFNACTVQLDASPVTGCIGFGNRSAMINVQPSARSLQRGDVIRFDVGCRYRHYRSDIARIGSLGEPPNKVADYHRALEAGVLRAYEVIRPGLKVSQLFEEVVGAVRRAGIPHYDRSHVGHGIGVDGYDPPNIAGSSTETLEENMVVCVETPYYELGFAGLQVEDMVLVTSSGAESLMSFDTGLRIV